MAGELILIVEDNEKKNRKLECDILQFHGYRTMEAETAEDGLRLIPVDQVIE
jgi:CheY-like chemotaxis protein